MQNKKFKFRKKQDVIFAKHRLEIELKITNGKATLAGRVIFLLCDI